MPSLVGSEMCIRDRDILAAVWDLHSTETQLTEIRGKDFKRLFEAMTAINSDFYLQCSLLYMFITAALCFFYLDLAGAE